MLKNVNDSKNLQRILLSLLSTSGTLAGLSMALVGTINLRAANTNGETIADDMFLLSSMGFLVVCYLIFFTLRRLQSTSVKYWANVIDVVFRSQ